MSSTRLFNYLVCPKLYLLILQLYVPVVKVDDYFIIHLMKPARMPEVKITLKASYLMCENEPRFCSSWNGRLLCEVWS